MKLEAKIDQLACSFLSTAVKEARGEVDLAISKLDDAAVIRLIEDVKQVLLPAHFSQRDIHDFACKYDLCTILERIYRTLVDQITCALAYHKDHEKEPEDVRRAAAASIAEDFLSALPTIREYLVTDLQAAFDGDPAAHSKDEIIYSYPGFYAILVNRIAHVLFQKDVPLIPRIMTEYAHSRTGIDIHPGATIGKYFFIDHGTGVVIGETTIIGEHVKIYQGVTLGGLSTRAGQGLRGKKRHPTICNDVTIYANASIFGGDTVIGEGVVVGGNCFITRSIPAHMRVSSKNAELQMKPDNQALSDSSAYWDYII